MTTLNDYIMNKLEDHGLLFLTYATLFPYSNDVNMRAILHFDRKVNINGEAVWKVAVANTASGKAIITDPKVTLFDKAVVTKPYPNKNYRVLTAKAGRHHIKDAIPVSLPLEVLNLVVAIEFRMWNSDIASDRHFTIPVELVLTEEKPYAELTFRDNCKNEMGSSTAQPNFRIFTNSHTKDEVHYRWYYYSDMMKSSPFETKTFGTGEFEVTQYMALDDDTHPTVVNPYAPFFGVDFTVDPTNTIVIDGTAEPVGSLMRH